MCVSSGEECSYLKSLFLHKGLVIIYGSLGSGNLKIMHTQIMPPRQMSTQILRSLFLQHAGVNMWHSHNKSCPAPRFFTYVMSLFRHKKFFSYSNVPLTQWVFSYGRVFFSYNTHSVEPSIHWLCLKPWPVVIHEWGAQEVPPVKGFFFCNSK